MIARTVFAVSALVVVWVYVGYPLALALLARLRPRPRIRSRIDALVSVVVPAHNEEEVIAAKIENVFASRYPRELIEVIVASDGSDDGTVDAARAAGAKVLDLPRVGKNDALDAAARAASNDILVFTDADAMFEPDTLAELVSNFADEEVGGVASNGIEMATDADGNVVARGEGLYWRYEHAIRRLEDRVGSTVSACGGLYAIRRPLYRPVRVRAGADDFLISTEVVRAGRRLAFDDRARVLLDRPSDAGQELRRKVRVMNGGLRAAFSLGSLLLPHRGGLYALEVVSHKILRRFVPVALVLVLAATSWLAATAGSPWTLLVWAQVAFYAAALVGVAGRGLAGARVFSVPYYFCLANLAALLALVSLVRGVRYERWEPSSHDRRAAGATTT